MTSAESETPKDAPKPRAFLSYSWTSDAAAERVRLLAERLVGDGVDVVLDQWDLRVGHDKFAFMEKMVTDPSVTHVLALSDRRYAERADSRDGGVGTETTILTPEVYAKARQERVIPVFLETDDRGEPALPTFLRSRWGVDMSSPQRELDGYEQLLRILFDRPRYEKPALGSPPTHLTSATPSRRCSAILHSLGDALQRGASTVYPLTLDLRRQVSKELGSLQFSEAPELPTVFDQVVVRMRDSIPLRDDLIKLAALLTLNHADERVSRVVGDLLEATLAEQRPAQGVSFREEQFDHYKLIAYELLLAAVSLCVKHERFDVLTGLTDRAYLAPAGFIGDFNGGPKTYIAFNGYLKTLEDHNRESRDRRRLEPTADLVKERATTAEVTFDELVGADLLLFLKSLITSRERERWHPHLLPYAQTAPGVLQRATYRYDFQRLKAFLHVSSGDDLRAKVEEGAVLHALKEWRIFNPLRPADRLLNLSALDTRD